MKRRSRVMLKRETVRHLTEAERRSAAGGRYTDTHGEECSGPYCTLVTAGSCVTRMCTVP